MAESPTQDMGHVRSGLVNEDGDCYCKHAHAIRHFRSAVKEAQHQLLNRWTEELSNHAQQYTAAFSKTSVHEEQPFVGAQPALLREPLVASVSSTEKATRLVRRTVRRLVESAASVLVVIAHDASNGLMAQELLSSSVDDGKAHSVQVALGDDFLHTIPRLAAAPRAAVPAESLVIYLGTPAKYFPLCGISSTALKEAIESAHEAQRLVVVCRGICMLPVGTQQENVRGIDELAVFREVADSLRAKGADVGWGHGPGSKDELLLLAYPSLRKAWGEKQIPKPLEFDEEAPPHDSSILCLSRYIKHLNEIKLANDFVPVVNYFDSGMLCSALQKAVAESGVSMLLDADGLSILRENSIGHLVSKLDQLITLGAADPRLTSSRGVFNFFIGDGAARLNGGAELAMHLIEDDLPEPAMITLWVFNNERWAIEDNLVREIPGEVKSSHRLFNKSFYDLLADHSQVCVCEDVAELHATLAHLSAQTARYLAGSAAPKLNMVIVRGISLNIPPLIGDIEPMKRSAEMKFLKEILRVYADGCKCKVPLYGCSAFEYIQYLDIFLRETSEGAAYQYVCGRTDIQAAQMAGFSQPEGRCVLFINDVYGINSLGETIRMVLSGFGRRQLLILIWHPAVSSVWDHFMVHRQPSVWSNPGMRLCQYYVRTESDAAFIDFDRSEAAAGKVLAAIEAKTSLILVNMLPVHECDFVPLDIRARA